MTDNKKTEDRCAGRGLACGPKWCYKHLRNKVKLCLFLLMPFQLFAGGSHFEVRVDNILTNGDEFDFVATIIGKFDYDESACKVISVSGEYDSVKWAKYTKLINEDIHSEAIRILQNNQAEGAIVNFGYIGAGLEKVAECKYESKGLFHDKYGVFSIYTRI